MQEGTPPAYKIETNILDSFVTHLFLHKYVYDKSKMVFSGYECSVIAFAFMSQVPSANLQQEVAFATYTRVTGCQFKVCTKICVQNVSLCVIGGPYMDFENLPSRNNVMEVSE